MIRLTYISTARRGIEPAEIEAILAASRRNNRRDGITGMLLFDGLRFLQALEGPPGAVVEAYARIRADARHRACVQLHSDTIASRAFGAWDMAWQAIGSVIPREQLAEQVDAMVAAVEDKTVRALFTSFARVERAA
ncbi:BLUF domain-containing protein [Sphingomonas morindae]|uniref:BLUF domain-containing protein n=1 Tax=Sphingomonas morindae TaxID=1541170 RepID=A0ABY4X590_9SPHN|nr:BLUF domain-containing protein [Sphingomonas morindae]USI72074.1 BLUF domain-containing protein [Sphingomonas morindae]